MSKSSKLGKIGSVRNFVNIVREVNLEELRANAEMAPRILVLAQSDDASAKVAEMLAGEARSPYFTTGRLDAIPRTGHGYDAVVVFDPSASDPIAGVSEKLMARELQLPVVAFGGSDPTDQGAAEFAREAIVTQAPERAPALGRHIPAFRPAAVQAVIDETARANAQFSLVSNLPGVIPVIGSLMAAGADMLVLTKNQVMMVFKIAAIHDRDVHDQWRILREITPVVGAGFFWRTLAREAASFLPLLIGTLPKVAVAYIGTVVAGRGADLYYRFGRKPDRQQMRELYNQAAESLKRMPNPLSRRPEDDAA
ncbi:MAG TPA: hypothetical protein VH482_37355 [Thermomicrobiales bacterium]|jgi:uncharacterized protein (DUF697 family)